MASGVFVWVYLGYFLVPTKKVPALTPGPSFTNLILFYSSLKHKLIYRNYYLSLVFCKLSVGSDLHFFAQHSRWHRSTDTKF